MKKFVAAAIAVLCFMTMFSCLAFAQQSFSFWSMWNEGEPQQQVLASAIENFEKEYDVKVDVRWAEFDYGFAVFRLVGHHGVVNIY